jgi:hypothetical protein
MEDPSRTCGCSLAIPQWKCDGCGHPVTADGFLTVEFIDAWHAQMEYAERLEREERHRKAIDDDLRNIGEAIKDYLDRPPLAQWRCFHNVCGENVESDYDIPIHQVNTWPKVINQWVHLSEKRWLEATSWMWLIHDVAGFGGPAEEEQG